MEILTVVLIGALVMGGFMIVQDYFELEPPRIFFLAFLLRWNYNSDMHVHYFLYYVIQKKT